MREPTKTVAFGDHELDFGRGELRHREKPVDIQPTPLRLLLYLAEHRDRVVSRHELLDAVWPGVVVGDEALTTALAEARHAVGDDGAAQRVIHTYKGRGVRFVAEVVEGEDAALPRWKSARLAAIGATLALALAAAAFVATRPREPEAAEPQPAIIAVIPISNLSGDAEAQKRADGLTEELLAALSGPDRVARVARAPTTSISADAVAVGRALDACCVFTGAVRFGSGRMRVTAELVSVADGTQLWSGVLDRPAGDPLRESEVIAKQIAWTLRLWTYQQRIADSAKSPEVGRLLRAMIAGPPQGKRLESVAAGERAIALDPSQWLAHAWVAYQLAELIDEGGFTYDEVAERIDAHMAEALRLAPQEELVHRTASRVHLFKWEWESALREGRIACEMAPHDFFACMPLVHALASTGQIDEALTIQRHIAAENPTLWGATSTLAALLATAGRVAEAEVECDQANLLADGAAELCAGMSWGMGHREKAVEILRRGYEANGLLTIAREIELIRDRDGLEAAWRSVAARHGRIASTRPTAIAPTSLRSWETFPERSLRRRDISRGSSRRLASTQCEASLASGRSSRR